MLSEKSFLALRLEGPLQSWGFDSQYNRRNTGLMPTKSGVAGICCAALGLPRGSDEEREFLVRFSEVRMIAISIPRQLKKELPVRRLQDFHTVQGTAIAQRTSGGSLQFKECHITHRQYLTDASFGILLAGRSSLIKEIADALANPVWGIWLGRKTCIPSSPVLAGVKNNKEDALCLLIGDTPIESFSRQEDVDIFEEGKDSLSDQPISFASERRLFAPRRVVTHHGR